MVTGYWLHVLVGALKGNCYFNTRCVITIYTYVSVRDEYPKRNS